VVYIKDIIKSQVYQTTRVSNNKIELNRVSFENIKYDRNKKIKLDLDPSKILFLKYLDFINIFSKTKTDILPEYDSNFFLFLRIKLNTKTLENIFLFCRKIKE
jgi:hypothetical protein